MLWQEFGIQWRKPVKFNQQSGVDAIPQTPNLSKLLGHSLDQDHNSPLQVWQKMQQVEQYLKISNPAAELRRQWGHDST